MNAESGDRHWRSLWPRRAFRELILSSLPLISFAASVPAGALLMNWSAARLLEQHEFGVFAVSWNTVQTFAAVGQASLSFAATRFTAQLAVRDPAHAAALLRQCLRWSYVSGAVVCAFLALGAPFFATGVLGQPDLEQPIRAAAAAVFFVVCSSVLGAGLLGTGWAPAGLSLAALQFTGPVVATLLGSAFGGAIGAMIGLGSAYLLRWLLGLWLLRLWEARSATSSPLPRSPGGRLLANFAAPSVVAGIVTPTAHWLALSTLASAGGLAGVALFVVAANVRNLAAFPAALCWQVFSVLINRAIGERRWPVVAMLTTVNLALVLAVVGGIAGAVVFFGDKLLGLFGPDYLSAQKVLAALLIAAVLDAAASALYQVVVGAGEMWRSLFWIVIPRDILLAVLAFIWTAGGADGLASAHAASSLIGFVATSAVAFVSWRRMRSSTNSRGSG